MTRADVPAGPAAALPAPPPPTRTGGPGADLRTIRVLWQRQLIRFGRNRVSIAMGLVPPLMFLFVLGTGLDSTLDNSHDRLDDFRVFLFPGVLLMAVQAPAVSVGASIVWDRQAGFLRQMLVAPVRRGAILAGTCVGGATTAAVYGTLVLVLAGMVGVPYGPRLLVALALLGLIGFAFTAFGVLMAVCIRRPETFQVVAGLCMMPLLFLSGAMFPPTGLPGWLGTAVLANPVTYAVDALRRVLAMDDLAGWAASPRWWGWTPPVLLEVGLVAVLAAELLAVAASRFARVE